MKNDIQYLKITKIWAECSSATKLKVGCIIVKDLTIISDGYNGGLIGQSNECEYIPYERKQHPIFSAIEVDTEGIIYFKNKIVTQSLHISGKYTFCYIYGEAYRCSKIIMETFVKNPDAGFYTQVNHIDYDVTNNKLSNLEWCSNRYNSLHRDARQFKTSQFPGVSKCGDRNKWVASALIGNRQFKKRFNTQEEAFEFYKLMLDKRHFSGIRFTGIKTYPHILHAEANAITKLAKSTQSSEGATIFITVPPCLECAKLIVQSGIKRVVFSEQWEKQKTVDGLRLLVEAQIEIEYLSLTL